MKKISFSSPFKTIVSFVKKRKIISTVILVVILGAAWWAYGAITSTSGETRYVLANVEKGTVVATISASGQVSGSSQLEIKPKVSGDIISINVAPGQQVAQGQLIAVIDPTDAQKSVRDAEANLESAQISLEKLQKPASALTLTQAENAVENAKDDLSTAYADGYTDVVNAYLDMPSILVDLEDILTGTDAVSGQWNMDYYENQILSYDYRVSAYADTAYNDFTAAKKLYDIAFADYQSLSGTQDRAKIEKLVSDTYALNQALAKAIKSSNSFIQLYVDTLEAKDKTPANAANTALTSLNEFTGTINGHLTKLLADQNSIKTGKQKVTESAQSLQDTKDGADALDVRSAQLTLTQRRNALADAQATLTDYYIRAPFAGTVATLGAKKYDTAGSGTSIATLITSQKIAELSLNEVDAAKMKVGNKATLTFDAIEDLTLTGAVAEVDAIGTVSQGVVSYSIKVAFDTQDERIKSGMTVNATIQTDVRQDVLTVPSSAVKTQNGVSSLMMLLLPSLQRKNKNDPRRPSRKRL